MKSNKTQGIVRPLAALSLALVSEVAWSAPPPESTSFQITVDHAGVTTSGGALALQESPAWSVALSSPFSPIIAGGRVFVTAGGSSELYAFDAKTGNPAWGPLNVTATWLTYDNGKLFSVNASGLMQSFDAATGAAGWSVQLTGQYAFSSAPTASNGIVYVGGAGSGGTLYAVNETNGTVLWTGSVMNGDDSSPAVGPKGVYVSYACPQVYDFALTSATAAGQLIWNYAGPCEGGGGNTPVYANGELYVRDWTTAPSSKIFNASTGALTGSFSATAAPAISSTNGFFLNSGTLTGTDLATNTVLWSFASSDGSALSTNPIVVDQTVIIGSSSGTLYGLNTLTGHLTWQVSTEAAITSQGDQSGFAVADGILVVPTASSLLAYNILGPPAPTGLTATGAAGAVNLNWSAAAGAATYNIYMGPSAGSENVVPVQTSVTGTSTTVTKLTPGTAYFFTVKAVGSAGISAPSNEVSATPMQLPAPPAPANLTAVAGSNQVTLSWTASSGATGYNIYMGTSSGGEAATPVMTGVLGVTATISGLTNGTTYFFVVKAANAAGSSPASNEASATPVPPPPPAPAGLSAVAASGQVTLSWAASAGATSYSVYMGTSAGHESTTAAQTGITGLSATITGLTNGTTYYYTVKAVDAGGASAASNEASATPKAPPPPQHQHQQQPAVEVAVRLM